jgi:hypothetical protein
MSRRWTRDDVCELRRLAALGLDASQVATALSRTIMAVRIKAAHLRVPLLLPARRQRLRSGPFVDHPPPPEPRREE